MIVRLPGSCAGVVLIFERNIALLDAIGIRDLAGVEGHACVLLMICLAGCRIFQLFYCKSCHTLKVEPISHRVSQRGGGGDAQFATQRQDHLYLAGKTPNPNPVTDPNPSRVKEKPV
jgi:hypothetical protein